MRFNSSQSVAWFQMIAAIVFGYVMWGYHGNVASGENHGPTSGHFTLEPIDHGISVKCDGELWANYITDGEFKPYVWPIIGPTGQPVTREWPMGEGAGEKHDHPHQKSMWFTHGDINKTDFWAEGADRGRTVHRKFIELSGGDKAVIVAQNDWLTADGSKILEDVRKLVFSRMGEHRVIDFNIRLTATADQVTFGDTKEGTFGLRVAESLTVDAKKGGKIVNSEGQSDSQAWGKQAKWVDYSGPVADQIVGIAVLNHPSSFRFPTYWHVRTYGLFAANPFGWHDFVGRSDVSGNYTMGKGQSIFFAYRVILHKGRAEDANITEAFKEYAAQPPETIP
ncbi:MAG: PmoA family protein [Thermogutta sp.]